MFIKSDGYTEKVESNKPLAIFLLLLGVVLMLVGLVSPWVHGIPALIIFMVGYEAFDKPYQVLTKDM